MYTREKVRRYLLSEGSLFIYIWIILFLFHVLMGRSRSQLTISLIQLAFIGNDLIMTVLNNYLVIPRWLMKGKYVRFTAGILGMIVIFAGIEEFGIEPLFSDSSRARATLRGLGVAGIKNVFLLALFSSIKLMWNYKQEQQKLRQMEQDKVESELKFLKSQISPHVLFNNLNNIYSYALEGSDKTPDMILKLSELMRYMLYEAREKWVSLQKEVDYLSDYIDLQKIRLDKRGDVRFNTEGRLENKTIAPLLLVAFVENSFKHGMAVAEDKVYIDIQLRVEKETLYFTTVNSRSKYESKEVGMKEEKGIGLDNVQRRLQLLYPDRHRLKVEEDEKRFYVYLEIDL